MSEKHAQANRHAPTRGNGSIDHVSLFYSRFR